MSGETQPLDTVVQNSETVALDEHELEFIEFLFENLKDKTILDDDGLRREAVNGVVLTKTLSRYELLCFPNLSLNAGVFGISPAILYVLRSGDEISILLSPDGEHQPQMVPALKKLISEIRSISVWDAPMAAWRNKINFYDFAYLWRHRQFFDNESGVLFVERDRWKFVVIDCSAAVSSNSYVFGVEVDDVRKSFGSNQKVLFLRSEYDIFVGLGKSDPENIVDAKKAFDEVLFDLKVSLIDCDVL